MKIEVFVDIHEREKISIEFERLSLIRDHWEAKLEL